MAPPAETTPPAAGYPPVTSRTNGTAIAAMASSVLCLFGLGSIIGIGLGVYALNQVAVTLLLSMIGTMMKLSAA